MEFMVSIQFRSQNRAEIMARIPQEQAHVKALREQGLVDTLYISADSLHVWIIMRSPSQEQLQKNLESFPLYSYMQLEIAPLAKM